MGENGLLLDEEIFKQMFLVVYHGLTIRNYIVPLMDIDIDLYNEDSDDCAEQEEEKNNEFIFNVPDPMEQKEPES